jgi:Tol biopolymer transport system component
MYGLTIEIIMKDRFVIGISVLLVLQLVSAACDPESISQTVTRPSATQSRTSGARENLGTLPTSLNVTTIPSTMASTPSPAVIGSGGSVIAFQSDRDRQDEIYVMNADGSDQRLLISNQWALDSMPAWSPDGTRIAFASRDRGKDFEICVVSAQQDLLVIQGEILKLTDNEFNDLHPTWSPDGRQIAFYSKRDFYNDIYVIDVAGTGEHQLTATQSNDKDPAWSPDGTLIAFVSNRENDNEIYVMNPDGSSQRALTENDSNEWSPAWSPDGSQIAFITDRHGAQDLYVMDADGSNARRLTDDRYPWNDDPAWSPDGSLIAFRSNRSDQVDIYLIKVNGSSIPQQLTFNSEIDQDRAPAWRPDNLIMLDEDDQ